MNPNPASALHQHEGHPVPWATRWTGEVIPLKLEIAIERGAVHLTYQDRIGHRDDRGVLWRRDAIHRAGEPEYSQLNAHRQRVSMLKQRCQVCGSKIDERPIRWLMSRLQLHRGSEENEWRIAPHEALTMSPPTCSACIPLALELCPHLKRQGYLILRVLDYEPWGVYGQAVAVDRETGQGRDLRGVYVPYDIDYPIELTATIAFQQVVKLTKYVVEEDVQHEQG